jgi:rubrerythrin
LQVIHYDGGMNKQLPRFERPADIIDFAIGREREAQAIYASYAAHTRRTGFRQLLLSMEEMEKEHEAKLLEVRDTPDLEGAFSPSAVADMGLAEILVEVDYSPDMEYGDFLILVIKKESKAEKLYRNLESLARTESLKHTFHLLAEEESKHKIWAQDRYDLEILKEN